MKIAPDLRSTLWNWNTHISSKEAAIANRMMFCDRPRILSVLAPHLTTANKSNEGTYSSIEIGTTPAASIQLFLAGIKQNENGWRRNIPNWESGPISKWIARRIEGSVSHYFFLPSLSFLLSDSHLISISRAWNMWIGSWENYNILPPRFPSLVCLVTLVSACAKEDGCASVII